MEHAAGMEGTQLAKSRDNGNQIKRRKGRRKRQDAFMKLKLKKTACRTPPRHGKKEKGREGKK